MSGKTLALFRYVQLGLVETTAPHEILNGRDYKSFIVIEGPVHELQMLLHILLKEVRGRQGVGVRFHISRGQYWCRPSHSKSGAMRLRTFFRLINTPQTPYSQT